MTTSKQSPAPCSASAMPVDTGTCEYGPSWIECQCLRIGGIHSDWCSAAPPRINGHTFGTPEFYAAQVAAAVADGSPHHIDEAETIAILNALGVPVRWGRETDSASAIVHLLDRTRADERRRASTPADEPYALEHWKSRAETAERERDSARKVLAPLRSMFRHQGMTSQTLYLRDKLREHDREWWTTEHAMNAVAEAVAGVSDDE